MSKNNKFVRQHIKDLVEINDESRKTYNINIQIKIRTAMLKSSLCDYSDAYKLVKETITVPNTPATEANANKKSNI